MSSFRDEVIGTTVLGRYRIVKRLAQGGMGVVYLARTEGAAGFSKPAVVKRILPDLTGDDKMTQMFVREARIMSNLHHPGIVGVLDFGEEDHAYIMVLEYVHGFHLGRWYRYVCAERGFFPCFAATYITIQVLESLHYAHTLKRADGKLLNVVHRDVSPSNILLGLDGQIKVADFGIARVSGETQAFKTEETTVKGKFPYLAPELFTGQAASVQSDLYACAVVMHELLLGRNEFRGREIADTIHRVFTLTPTLDFPGRDDVSPGVAAALRKALAKAPQDRFASAAEFTQALRGSMNIPEDQTRSKLGELIRQDFTSDMAAKLGLEPLEALDAAWRSDGPDLSADIDEWESDPAGKLPTASSPRPGTSSGRQRLSSASQMRTSTTEAMRRSASSSQGQPSVSAWRSWPVVAGFSAVALGGLAMALWSPRLQRTKASKAQVIVIEQEKQQLPVAIAAPSAVSPSPSAPPPAADPSPLAESEAAAPKAAGQQPTKGAKATRNETRHEANDSVELLTRLFRGKQSDIRACFRKYPDELHVQGTPRIAVSFAVDSRGRVTRAELVPSPLEKTNTGKCVLQIARNMNFGPQRQEVAFMIPVQISGLKTPPNSP